MSVSSATNTGDTYPAGYRASSQATESDIALPAQPIFGDNVEDTLASQGEYMSMILAVLRNLRGDTSTARSCTNIEDDVHWLSLSALGDRRNTGATLPDWVAHATLDSDAVGAPIRKERITPCFSQTDAARTHEADMEFYDRTNPPPSQSNHKTKHEQASDASRFYVTHRDVLEGLSLTGNSSEDVPRIL